MKRFRGLGERFSPNSRWAIRRLYPGQAPSSFSRYGMRYDDDFTRMSPMSPRARGVARTATVAGRNVRRRLFGGLEEETPLLEDTPIAVGEEAGLARLGYIGLALIGVIEAYRHRRGIASALSDDWHTATHPLEDVKQTLWNMFDPLHLFHHSKPKSTPNTTANHHPNGVSGSSNAKAVCYPGCPNHVTMAIGTPIAATA